MPGYDRVFLTQDEALEAVRMDIEGYGPQPELYGRMQALLSGAHAAGAGMDKQVVLELLSGVCVQDGRLARLCSLVFDAACRPGEDADGQPGLWIATGMEEFACTRCGRCCLALDFHRECTAEDVALWRELGRTDILAWVHEECDWAGESSYRIWKDPRTGFYAEACPWLRRIPGDRAFVCAIQDVKPEVCRSYPGLRKHALMTGCRGFGCS